jgi:hypothetical protein
MSTEKTNSAAAQPADEELKKHGDQLARQVTDAAAGESGNKGGQQPEKEVND